MRIAIYEPERLNGGTSTWANYLKLGLLKLGHETEIVTFTRSGKPKKSWLPVPGRLDHAGAPIAYDQVTKYETASEFLNGYDGVILSDFLHPAQDNQAKLGLAALNPTVPDYVSVLRGVTRPTTVAIHTSDYSVARQPYVTKLLDVPGLTGRYVANSRDAVRSACFDVAVRGGTVYVPLPYQTTERPLETPLRSEMQRPVVALAGRYSAIKGHRVLAAAAIYGYLPPEVDVHLWGASDRGPGPAPSGNTYEVLRTFPNVVKDWLEDGTPYRDRRWRLATESNTVSYGGPYDFVRLALLPAMIHCNLTTAAIPGGSLEYTQLESIDVGCLQVALAHRWDDRLEGVTLTSTTSWPGDLRLLNRRTTPAQLRELGGAVDYYLNLDPAERNAMIEHNRDLVRTVHDPEAVATAYVDALFN